MHINPLFMTYNSGPFFLFIAIISYYVLLWLKKIILDSEEEDDQLTEGLSDYYNAIMDHDRANNIGQEEYFLEKCKMRTFTEG
jgi:hypothetical protein